MATIGTFTKDGAGFTGSIQTLTPESGVKTVAGMYLGPY
jgi:uncharacterized protein (DUF736 family)